MQRFGLLLKLLGGEREVQFHCQKTHYKSTLGNNQKWVHQFSQVSFFQSRSSWSHQWFSETIPSCAHADKNHVHGFTTKKTS